MEEASGALHAAESEASKRQRELLKLQRDHEANIEQAVGRAVSEYKEQLTAAKQRQQSKDRKHQQTVHQLQDRVRALELSLASQATLPSVHHTKEEADLWEEIFNYLPGTVNTRGAPRSMNLRISHYHSRNTSDLGTGPGCLI